jgi:protein SCO1/2
MNPRHIRIMLMFGICLVGLILTAAVAMLVTGRAQQPGGQPVAAIGGPFKLINQDGRTVTDQDFKGKPFLVFFGFTHCPEICPATLFEISEVLRKLGPDAARTHALFITVDPEQDTPKALKDYLSSFDPHMSGLTGDAEAIAAGAKAYRVVYRKVQLEQGGYTMDHTAIIYLMDKQGRFVVPFSSTLKRGSEAAATELRKHL